MATSIKIRLPNKLPPSSEGLTAVQFKAWKGQLIVYLKQNADFKRFLTGGCYATWSANDEHQDRLRTVHATDQPADNTQIPQRLAERQTQLETVLSIIAGNCDFSQYDDIMQRSTSIDWIWNLIESDYDIQKKGRHFLKVDEFSFKKGQESYNAFYKRLRGHFSDNLRKAGERVKSKNNEQLTEDEKLSPTLENTIVYMALKDIDSRLPAYIEQIFGHRMDRDTTLYDLQAEIFQSLPKLLADIEAKEANLGYVAADDYQTHAEQNDPAWSPTGQQEQPSLAAFGYGQRGGFQQRGQYRPRGSAPPRYSAAPRGYSAAPRGYSATPRGRPMIRFRLPAPATETGKLCNLCRDAGFPRRVYETHNMNACNRWDRSTVAQIRSMVLDDNINPMDYPEHTETYQYQEEEEA